MENLITIQKDEKQLLHINYPDEMSDYEVLGILTMMAQRMERHIFTEEVRVFKFSGEALEKIISTDRGGRAGE